MTVFYTNSEEHGLVVYNSFRDALKQANKDPTVWKISFDVGDERVRLVRYGEHWIVEQMENEIKKELELRKKKRRVGDSAAA